MAQNKEGSEKKPGVKIQDLSPKKDAKGGFKSAEQNRGFDQNKGGGLDPNKGGGLDQNRGTMGQSGLGGGNQN